MTSPLDDDRVRAFVRRSLIVSFATRSAKGRPFVTPLWFVADAGIVYITTGPGSRAARNVERQPQAALLFRGERLGPGGGFLELRGTATPHRGLPPWRVLLRIAAKYYVAPGALALELRNARRWRLRARYYAQGGVGFIRFAPVAAQWLSGPG